MRRRDYILFCDAEQDSRTILLPVDKEISNLRTNFILKFTKGNTSLSISFLGQKNTHLSLLFYYLCSQNTLLKKKNFKWGGRTGNISKVMDGSNVDLYDNKNNKKSYRYGKSLINLVLLVYKALQTEDKAITVAWKNYT